MEASESAESTEQELEEIEEIPPPPPDDSVDQLYQVWMSPTCKSRNTMQVPHQPTFMFVSAENMMDASLKAILIAQQLRGIDCTCQVQIREVEAWV